MLPVASGWTKLKHFNMQPGGETLPVSFWKKVLDRILFQWYNTACDSVLHTDFMGP